MIIGKRYQDTPSIIHKEITMKDGRKLKYSDLTGVEKRDYLFDEGIRPTAYENYQDEERPDVITGLLQFQKSALQSIANKLLSETLTRVSDELEEPKPKLFHTYGTTAKVVFTPEPDTPYTGLFSEKVHGLARFSYAGPVIAIGVVPGLGLKFPVDKDKPSENLVVMNKLDRQQPFWRFFSKKSHNSVFQNPFTNILPFPIFFNFIMRIVNKRFETVVEKGKGLHQAADNLAKINTNGKPVQEDKINYPYRLIFQPTNEATKSSNPKIDFRDDLAKNIRIGTPIYLVFALNESQELDFKKKSLEKLEELIPFSQKIGKISTESEFIASKYGDYRLFFKHSELFIRDEFKNGQGQ